MRRIILLAAFLAPLVAAGAHPARAADAGINIRIGDRYHGAGFSFTTRPEMTVVPGSRVYYIQDSDNDVYRYGRYYYGYDSGRWYRASDYRGPWVYVRGRTVPRQIYTVPADYRHHWEGDYRYWHSHDYDDNWEHYQGGGVNRNGDMSPSGDHRDMDHTH